MSHTFDPSRIFSSPKYFENKFDKIKEVLGKRKGPNIKWLQEYPNDDILAIPGKHNKDNMPTMARVLNDFEDGIVVFAGQPNAGKSCLLVNMMLQALRLNDDLVVLDISLDDPPKKRYQQYIAALSGLHYQEITTSSDLTEEQLSLRNQADVCLTEMLSKSRLIPLDSSEHIKSSDGAGVPIFVRSFQTIFNMMRKAREIYPEKKIAFFIDSWNNLDFTASAGDSDLAKVNTQLGRLKEEATKYGIMLVLSAHVRKTNGKKVVLEDIKGTKDMEYHCVLGAIVRNEWKENALINPLIYTEADSGKRFPILTVEIHKTKVSTWEWPLFYALKSGQCQIVPLDPTEYHAIKSIYDGNRK